jgi:GntR family transcriptional regulator
MQKELFVSLKISPLYQQIKTLLLENLKAAVWKPGEPIPSEMELAAHFSVSQGTVRKAIDALTAENLLIRRQGKGTFVATHHEARAQFRFLRLVPDQGVPHYPENRILEVKSVRAPADVALALGLRSGGVTIFLRRVQSFAGVPTILDELWLPGTIFKGLTFERLVAYRGPMYGLFETEFATHMIRATEKIRAVCADRATADVLEVKQGAPLMSVERISFTFGDKPVELRRGLYLTNAHHYQNELT